MQKLMETVPNIRALAARTHPVSKKAQDIFTVEQVTKAATRLGHEDPEYDALEAIEAYDQSLPLDQESDDDLSDNDGAKEEVKKPTKKSVTKSRRG